MRNSTPRTKTISTGRYQEMAQERDALIGIIQELYDRDTATWRDDVSGADFIQNVTLLIQGLLYLVEDPCACGAPGCVHCDPAFTERRS